MKAMTITYVFAFCFLLVAVVDLVTGRPIYLSAFDIGGFVGQAIGLFGMSGFFCWLLQKIRPTLDPRNFPHRWAAIAAVCAYLSFFSYLDDDAADALGLATLAVIVAGTVWLLGDRKKILQTLSAKWRNKSTAFRAWAFLSFFWGLGIFLFVALADPYNAGSWSGMDEDEDIHMLAVMTIPPLFCGGLWFGYRRFVL